VELTVVRAHVVELKVPVRLELKVIVPVGVVGLADVSFTVGVQLVAWLMKIVDGVQLRTVVVGLRVTMNEAVAPPPQLLRVTVWAPSGELAGTLNEPTKTLPQLNVVMTTPAGLSHETVPVPGQPLPQPLMLTLTLIPMGPLVAPSVIWVAACARLTWVAPTIKASATTTAIRRILLVISFSVFFRVVLLIVPVKTCSDSSKAISGYIYPHGQNTRTTRTD